MRYFPALALCAAILLVAASPRAEEADLARRLETQREILRQLENDLATAREEADRIRATEQDAAVRAVEASNRVSLISHAISELEHVERTIGGDMGDLTARRAELRRRIADRRILVARRVRALYMHGRAKPYARALLGDALADWAAARQYVAALNRRDAMDIVRLRADRRRLDSLAVIYSGQRSTYETLIGRKARERAALVEADRDARSHLLSIRRNRLLAERVTAELEAQREASRARIDEYVADRGRRDSDGVGNSTLAFADFSEEKGRLPWPVRGDIVARFGRQRDRATRTWTRNRGIDIRAAAGANISAVADGQVVMVDWFRGYGTFVLIAHGRNYYTLYANLGAIAVRKDDVIRRGQVLGQSSADAALGEPRVHFELLAGHDALDPLEWLIPRRRPS